MTSAPAELTLVDVLDVVDQALASVARHSPVAARYFITFASSSCMGEGRKYAHPYAVRNTERSPTLHSRRIGEAFFVSEAKYSRELTSGGTVAQPASSSVTSGRRRFIGRQGRRREATIRKSAAG